MALPPVLSPPDLAKFRTKLCERLLSTGSCHYADRCQYSHDPVWPRRNPEKVRYMPVRCSDAGCTLARACGLAHTDEEVLYHPEMYKEAPCPGNGQCLGFYCPFSHGAEDHLSGTPEKEQPAGAAGRAVSPEPEDHAAVAAGCRRRGPRHRAGRRHARQRDFLGLMGGSPGTTPGRLSAKCPLSPGAPESDESELDAPLWDASDRLRVAAVPGEVTALGGSGREVGAALLGGRLLPGWLRRGSVDEPTYHRCAVKLLPVGRDDRATANEVLSQVQRWAESDRSRARLFVVRKTKATICLAVPAQPSTLDRSVSALGGGLVQHMERHRHLGLLAAQWVRQLAEELSRLHSRGVGHLCISPRSVLVTASGGLFLGDFLGKVRALQRLGGAAPAQDRWCDMWYPAEALSTVAAERLDQPRADAWQLGIVVCFLLCGEHLFGDCRRDPEGVCRNIAEGRPVNARLLRSLPVFADLVFRLTMRDPGHRPLPSQLLEGHPALWSLDQTARFGHTLPARLLALRCPEAESTLRAVLDHLPWASALGAVPASPPPPPTALRAVEVLAVAAEENGGVRTRKAELHWHLRHLDSRPEDPTLLYEEAAAWERWGRPAAAEAEAAAVTPPPTTGSMTLQNPLLLEHTAAVVPTVFTPEHFQASQSFHYAMSVSLAEQFDKENLSPNCGAGIMDKEPQCLEPQCLEYAMHVNFPDQLGELYDHVNLPEQLGEVYEHTDLQDQLGQWDECPDYSTSMGLVECFEDSLRCHPAEVEEEPGISLDGWIGHVNANAPYEQPQLPDCLECEDFSQPGAETRLDLARISLEGFHALLELRRRRLNTKLKSLARGLRRAVRAVAVP